MAAEQEVNLKIQGMTCAACANRIEKGLNKVAGVTEANVNFAIEKAKVVYNPDETGLQDFEDKIDQLGYGVAHDKQTFDISGMTCAACANRIEKRLNKMDGVSNATVNFALENTSVEYDSNQVTVNDMMETIKKLGYTLKIPTSKEDTESDKDATIRHQTGKFIFSAILTLPLLWTMVTHFEFTSFIYAPAMLMNPWVQLAFAAPVQFIVGAQFYQSAYKSLKNGSANMDVLVALGTSVAFFYSLFLGIEWQMNGQPGMPDLYFEAASVIITLILLGKLFEVRAKGRTGQAIQKATWHAG
jgi:Cu+-exporting ATPase